MPHAAAVGDRAMEPDCRPDLKSNGTSETSAPPLLRRDRSPNGWLSGPDRAPAGASAGFTDEKWRTAAAPYDGADGAPATRRPRAPRRGRQAAVRSQTNAGAHRPSGDGGPGGVAGSRRARMPPGGNRTARAHEFGAAHARSTGRSAAQRWTGAHGLEPRTAEKNRSNLVTPCHDKHSGSRKGEIT